MDEPPLEGVLIIGIFLTMATFGLYTFVFIQTLYYVNQRSSRPILISVKLSILWLLILLSTIFLASGVYDALITSDADHHPSPKLHWWQTAATITVTFIATVLANLFICWRLYTVSKRDLRVLIAPAILELAHVACSVVAIIYLLRKRTREFNKWGIAKVVLNLAVNGLVIAMMYWKIWRIQKAASNFSETSHAFYQHALHVLIESGALCSFFVLFWIITRGTNLDNVSMVITYLTPQVVGLVPTLLVLRLQRPTKASDAATGRYTLPPTSQQHSISQPVFANIAGDIATQTSERHYSIHLKTMTAPNDKILSYDLETTDEVKASKISPMESKSDSGLENPRTS